MILIKSFIKATLKYKYNFYFTTVYNNF